MGRLAIIVALLLGGEAAWAQRGKGGARDLFYSEAGLIVSPKSAGKGRFGSARRSTVALTLGLKYRLWKISGEQAAEIDPAAPLRPGEQIRLGLETNDTGYLYIVHRQPSGLWRRVFPTSEIEGGNHFIRSGVSYAIPPEEGLELQFAAGAERLFLVLSREPVKELEALVSPRQPEGTVSAAPAPEISDAVVEAVRKLVPNKDLVTERDAGEKTVYVVNRTGQAESLVVSEVRMSTR